MIKTRRSIIWISISILLEYLMKFNTVSLYWHNLKFSIIIIFSRLLHYTFTTWNLKLKVHYQSQLIKFVLVHPQTINLKTISVTLHWLNLMFWCYQYTTPQQLQMINCYNDSILKSIHYTYTTRNSQALTFLTLHCNHTTYDQQAITLQPLSYSYTSYN